MEGLGISPQTIQDANRRLGEFIDSIRVRPSALSITAERMSSVLAEVMQIGDWARAISEESGHREQGTLVPAGCNSDAALQTQLRHYRHLLEQLRSLLPDFHAQLLTERCRLHSERAHLDSAGAWARSASQSG